MAKVAFSAIISGARGSLGGVVFSANASGPYMKHWARSPRKSSPRLNTVRSTISAHGAYWWSLSQAQRDAWNTWAALPAQEKTNPLGDPYYASGWNWFVALNQRLVQIGRTRISVYPTTSIPPTPTLTRVNIYNTARGLFKWTYPADEWDTYDFVGLVSLTAGVGRSVGFTNSALAITLVQAPVGSTEELTYDLHDIFGQLIDGQRAFGWAYRQNTEGRRSAAAMAYDEVS